MVTVGIKHVLRASSYMHANDPNKNGSEGDSMKDDSEEADSSSDVSDETLNRVIENQL